MKMIDGFCYDRVIDVCAEYFGARREEFLLWRVGVVGWTDSRGFWELDYAEYNGDGEFCPGELPAEITAEIVKAYGPPPAGATPEPEPVDGYLPFNRIY